MCASLYFVASFHDGDDLIAPPVSGLLKPQESMQVVRMNELLTDIKDKVFEVCCTHIAIELMI